MKRKYQYNLSNAAVIDLPEIKFTKAKMEFEEASTFEENAAVLGGLLVDDVEAIATSLPKLSTIVNSLMMDVKTLDLNLSSLITDIGSDPRVAEGLPFSTVWRALQHVAKLGDVGLSKICILEKTMKYLQGPEKNQLMKDITNAKTTAFKADVKSGHAFKTAQQAQDDYTNFCQAFITFRDFISAEIPKALKILMDGHKVASGSTN